MVLRTVFAFLAAPLVGAIVGGLAMSAAVPGPAAMFSIMYVVFGGLVAVAASVVVGAPAVLLLRRAALPLLPWLVAVAVGAGLLITVGVQGVLTESCCAFGPTHNVIFAVASSAVTAILVGVLLSENAL